MPMIFGLSTFGFAHTALSLLALASGLVVVLGLLMTRMFGAWTALYFASALAAVLTGFGFPGRFGIPQALGVAALLFILVAMLARYAFRLAGWWRPAYAVAAILSVWSFVFFTIGEAFLRLPVLKPMAPTLTELPFILAQAAALSLFVAAAIAAAKTFRPPAGVEARPG